MGNSFSQPASRWSTSTSPARPPESCSLEACPDTNVQAIWDRGACRPPDRQRSCWSPSFGSRPLQQTSQYCRTGAVEFQGQTPHPDNGVPGWGLGGDPGWMDSHTHTEPRAHETQGRECGPPLARPLHGRRHRLQVVVPGRRPRPGSPGLLRPCFRHRRGQRLDVVLCLSAAGGRPAPPAAGASRQDRRRFQIGVAPMRLSLSVRMPPRGCPRPPGSLQRNDVLVRMNSLIPCGSRSHGDSSSTFLCTEEHFP